MPQSSVFTTSLFTNHCKWWKSPESQYHDRKRGKMPFQPNVVILKGRAIGRSLPQTMVHIFSQWGSLMCEQGSGRAVNRPLYEAVRGELGCQWRGLSHVCRVSTLDPGLFVLMAARDWRDCGPCLHWICVKQESSHSMRNWPLRLHQGPQVQSISSQGFRGRTHLLNRVNQSWQFDNRRYAFARRRGVSETRLREARLWKARLYSQFTVNVEHKSHPLLKLRGRHISSAWFWQLV